MYQYENVACRQTEQQIEFNLVAAAAATAAEAAVAVAVDAVT